jgi:large subunit ribosomal protein L3
MKGLIGKKVGMTSIFDAKGNQVNVTVVEVTPNVVTQVKTVATDGYNAVQLGTGNRKEKNTPKALLGHFKKSDTTPKAKVIEFRDFDFEKTAGETVAVDIFQEGEKVNVVGTSKGKGFQGVVKRHGFSGVGMASHGQHNRLRAPGSMGASSWPSRVFKGIRMAGRMGNDRVKVKNLKVVKVFAEKNLIFIEGAIPGHNNSFVTIEK